MSDVYDELLYRPITDLMDVRYSRIAPTDSATQTFRMLAEDPDHVLIVTDEGSKFSGIITLEDQAKKFQDFSGKTASDFATQDRTKLVGVRSTANLGQLLRLMSGENKLNRPVDNVPVVDDEDRVVGLVNRDRLDRKIKLIAGASNAR